MYKCISIYLETEAGEVEDGRMKFAIGEHIYILSIDIYISISLYLTIYL